MIYCPHCDQFYYDDILCPTCEVIPIVGLDEALEKIKRLEGKKDD